MNKQRLLDVARACREAPKPEDFNMEKFANACGTPACALGHYAARHDLQNRFSLHLSQKYGSGWIFCDGKETGYDHPEVLEWFGIDRDEAEELFAAEGCGAEKHVTEEEDEDGDPETVEYHDYIRNPIEAAEYIEDFVRRHDGEVSSGRTWK